ncbi:hypothetical protein DFS33DRAFT_1450647 [Desarmillaria ectypa]|nr:hypothetical protein DFS33DRAFT_1450647 [Desarmillaria ectypa]
MMKLFISIPLLLSTSQSARMPRATIRALFLTRYSILLSSLYCSALICFSLKESTRTRTCLFHKHLQLFPIPADSSFLLTMISMTISSTIVKKRMKTRTRTPGTVTMRTTKRKTRMRMRTRDITIIMTGHSKCSLPRHCVFWSFLRGHLTLLERCLLRSLLACIP